MTEEERLKKRLEAAFLLLHLCPRCGEKCKVKYHQLKDQPFQKKMTCPVHGVMYFGPAKELWGVLQKFDGV